MNLIEKAAKHLAESNALFSSRAPVPSTLPISNNVDRASDRPDVQPFSSNSVSPQLDIDLGLLAAAGFVTPNFPKSVIAEQFRVLKRPLLANLSSRSGKVIDKPNLIMVTSALPREGKTFTAVNLAISIAMELDQTVLLIDADVARPSLPRVLGLPEKKGLLDVLRDKSLPFGDVIFKTNIEKLNVVMAGTPNSKATELLASRTMIDLLDEIAKRYPDRVIVFDSPPLLVTTESRVLASHMGQIVFVVQAEQTLQSALKDGLKMIQACPVKYMMLNQAKYAGQETYGYGYT